MKMTFFVARGLDSFLPDVIDSLSKEYETRLVVVDDLSQIEPALEKTDIAWFEWCDELIVHASRLPVAWEKRIVCRLHSYEAFTNYPARVNWAAVDLTVFVSAHVRDYAVERFQLDGARTRVIPNGVRMEKYGWRARTHGRNVAFAGYINYKKGPMLLLHAFREMHERDARYRLHIAGAFQDERDVLYFRQMIPLLGLSGSVVFDGWQDDLDKWLEDKDYILLTSVLESQNMSVMQAMAKGIKPIVHNFVGAGTIYPQNCLFNTIPEAADMLAGDYDPAAYRRFVEDYCGMEKIARLLRSAISSLGPCADKRPLVSVVMPVYNRERFLGEAIQSALDQSYQKIELIIVNDGSTDGSEAVVKSFSDERIRYIAKENGGQLDALRVGFRAAGGDYLCRLDSDDRFDRDYVKACMDAMLGDSGLRFAYTDLFAIGTDGEELGPVALKEYDDPGKLLLDVFTGFNSAIPDVSFWKRDYIGHVLTNYAGQNVPFYIDNILAVRYRHIPRPLYHYRKHASNFAADSSNFRYVLAGKIKFIDLIMRKYFIQSDIFGLFRRDRRGALTFFAQYYESVGRVFASAGAEEGVLNLFGAQADFWRHRLERPEEPESACLNPRILIVSADDPREGRAVGGKHTHIHLLMRALADRDVPCALATCALKRDEAIDPSALARAFSPPPEALNAEDSGALGIVYAMQKQLEDRVRAHLNEHFVSCLSCQDVIAATAARRVLDELGAEIPIATTLHGYFADENVDYGLLQAGGPVHAFFLEYERRAYAASDRIVAVDARIADYAARMTDPDRHGRISVLPNAVDDREFRPCGAPAGNAILVPRRLVPKNGVRFAVLAARALADRGLAFEMFVAGDGPERPEIEGIVSECGLSARVHILGAVPHDRMGPLYAYARVVVVPSIPSNNVEEATSLSALEGMACGRIVVASAIGGLKEILSDGQNGLLVEPGNADALADALQRALMMDGEEYARIGNAARERVEGEHGVLRHAERFLAIFGECANDFGLESGAEK